MFKKICRKCKNKIEKSYGFCPFCGTSQTSEYEKEDYGLLGKNDFIENNFMNIEDSFMEKMFDNAFKMAEKILEKQLKNFPDIKEQVSETKLENPHLNIKFFVNGKKVYPNKREIKVNPIKNKEEVSEKNKEKLAKLPRIEPSSKIKRIGEKIIYEIPVPGVQKIEDVLISQLENSIEVKAISDKKIYFKTLNINLPLLKYSLFDGNLVLELQGNKI